MHFRKGKNNFTFQLPTMHIKGRAEEPQGPLRAEKRKKEKGKPWVYQICLLGSVCLHEFKFLESISQSG